LDKPATLTKSEPTDASYELISDSQNRLIGWLDKEGWAGYDPYDVLAQRPFLEIESLRVGRRRLRKILYPLILLPSIFPKATRKLLRTQKTFYPKAAALIARAWLNRYEAQGDKHDLIRARAFLRWLANNHAKGYDRMCWGHPKDWQTLIFLPGGTPCAVVTCVAAQAFAQGYQLTGERWLLDAASDSCRFLAESLQRFEDTRGLCFSYTPLDNERVHNANLLTASTMALVQNMNGEQVYTRLIRKAVSFSLSDQTDEGGFFYFDSKFAEAHDLPNSIDSYHSALVIESLAMLARILPDENIGRAFKRAFTFYQTRLLVGGYVPIKVLGQMGPIIVDIHDCAETIALFSRLYCWGLLPDFQPAARLATWVIENLQDKSGYFYHGVYRWGKDTFPYVRRSEAWMMYALGELMKAMAFKERSQTRRFMP